ncbi:type II CAAX prenyl endopeptidase Rce1 family protein [Galbibacter sp. EGI 63066]|uniref:CPBP family glutamic-type intramembrane protease n=1 Tax=Galbibacter sp. EGI 63066 TaxID=2993559 RepID=UPI003A521AC6
MRFLLRISKFKFILYSITLCLLANVLLSKVILLYNENSFDVQQSEEGSIIFRFIVIIILAPLLETLLYQFIIIEAGIFLFNKKKKTLMIIILISSIMFGLSHCYNLSYIILGVSAGIILSLLYVLCKLRKDISPFFFVFIVHSFVNFTVYLVNNIFSIDI